MKLKDLTLDNIKNYIQGYSRWFANHWRLLAPHEQEQVLYRASQCPPECARNNECVFCHCDFPQKLFNDASCNRDKQLPDLMGKQAWEEYKQKLKKEKNERNT